jgi:hypothetical protein
MAVTINGNGTLTGVSIDGTAQAWINFNGTGTPSIRASSNISSITDNGTGNYRINFSSAFSDTNYILIGSLGQQGYAGEMQYFSQEISGKTTSYNDTRLYREENEQLYDVPYIFGAWYR